MAVTTLDLDSAVVKPDKLQKFKVEEGKAYRIGFPFLNENGRISITQVDFFTYEDANEKYHSWRKSDNEEVNEIATKAGASLKTRYVTPIVVYRTNREGKPLTPVSGDVMPFVFDSRKLGALKSINEEWDLATVDVTVTSSNPTMQDMTFVPLKTAIWKLTDAEQLKKLGMAQPMMVDIESDIKLVSEAMVNSVAFELSDAKIKEICGVAKTADAAGTADPDADVPAPAADIDGAFADIDPDDLI